MKGKIIVITGATRGVGLELKKALEADNTVITMSRSEVEGDTSYSVDLSLPADIKRAFDDIGAKHGRIDVLINNAGYGLSGATENIPNEEIRRITDVNFLGTVYASKYALPYMQKGAKIINIGSASGLSPMPFRTMYNSTKAALSMFSYSLSLETAHLGIGCTVIVLGAVRTNFAGNRTKLTDTSSRYATEVSAVDAFVDSQGDRGKMKTKTVVNALLKIMDKRKLKMKYIIGVRYKLANLFFLFFPSLTMKITQKVMTKRN